MRVKYSCRCCSEFDEKGHILLFHTCFIAVAASRTKGMLQLEGLALIRCKIKTGGLYNAHTRGELSVTRRDQGAETVDPGGPLVARDH